MGKLRRQASVFSIDPKLSPKKHLKKHLNIGLASAEGTFLLRFPTARLREPRVAFLYIYIEKSERKKRIAYCKYKINILIFVFCAWLFSPARWF